MTKHPARHLIVLLASVALLVGACGGDDGAAPTPSLSDGLDDIDPDEENETSGATGGFDPGSSDFDRADYVSAVTDDLAEDTPEFDIGEEDVACVAAALIDVAGVERLLAEGISPEQFAAAESIVDLGIDVDDAEVDRLGQAMDACMEFKQLLDSAATDGAACLLDNFDEPAFSRAFADELATGASTDVVILMLESAEPACAERLLLESGVAQGDITEEQASCVADVLDDEVARRIMMAGASPQGPSEADGLILVEAFTECGIQR